MTAIKGQLTMKESLYDIIGAGGLRLFKEFANDPQCEMYYDPEGMAVITYAQIETQHWEVIEAGYYDEWFRAL